MKVKKYVGETIQDTIFKVKADLGSDAIILNTKKTKKGGIFGFFAKKQVEVLAAREDEDKDQEKTLSEINDLKNMIGNLQNNWSTGNDYLATLPEYLQSYYKFLKEQGIRTEINRKIMESIKNNNLREKEEIVSLLKEELKAIVGQCSPIEIGNEQKIVLFSGPTGVGKTTTIAKLAADFSLKQDKNVGLVTADTYRIAAVQQLKTYSDIVNLPLKILYDNQQLEEIINNDFANYDLILIDTAGSSWNDEMQLGRLKKISKQKLIDEVHLLLSLNTKSEDLISIINQFSCLDPDKLLLTKLDETVTYGDIINLCSEFEFPYSYITNGQDVPEDIEKASPDKLVNYVMGDIDV
ncbi:MAG: DEAD/DEAH box helicase family protein [Bacillota bacterium]